MVFFRKYLADAVREDSAAIPMIAPKMLTMNEFFFKVSGAEPAGRVALLLELYECYRKLNRNAEPLDDFIFWGDVILADFDDVDKYLADPGKLYANVADFRQLQDTFTYLTDTQRAAIEHFISHFRDGNSLKVNPDSDNPKVKEKFLGIWNIMARLYADFNKSLEDKNLAYEGMAYRRFASRLSDESAADILQEAFCKLFDQYQLTVEIRAKKREGTFWEAVDEQCLTYNDRIQHVVYEFPDDDEVGPIDASRQTMDKLTLLKSLNAAMNAARGVYHAYSSKEKTIQLDKTQEDIANMVAMCCQNGYNISVHFQHYGVYRFGTDIKALSQLKDEVVKEFVDGQTVIGKTVEGEWALVHWLDEIRKVTENYKDEEPVAKKRKGSHQYQMEEESNMGRVAESE